MTPPFYNRLALPFFLVESKRFDWIQIKVDVGEELVVELKMD